MTTDVKFVKHVRREDEKKLRCSAIERRNCDAVGTRLATSETIVVIYSHQSVAASKFARTGGNGTSGFHFSSSLLSSEVPSSDAVLEAAIERALALTSLTFMPVIFHAGQTFRRMMHYLGCNSGRARPGPRGTNAREMGQEHPAECRSSSGRSIDLQT